MSLLDTWAFSATSLPLAALAVTIGVYLSPHYSDQKGIALDIAAVGAAFGIVRLIDIPIDFMLGLAMDRTRTRWGRFRLWTIIGAPITFVAVYMLYFAKPGVDMLYLVIWLLIMYIGTSILTLSHSAWAATLARSYDERSRLYGIMAAVGVLGSTLVLATPGVLEILNPGSDVGVQGMGWFILAFVPLAAVLVVWRTPEKLAPETHGKRFGLKDYWSLAARPSMGRIIVADFFLSMGPQWTGALYVFFFTDSRGFTRTETMWLLVLYMFAGFFGAPLIARLAMAISKHRAAMISIAGWGIVLASLMLMPHGHIWIGGVQMFALGFLAAGFNVVTRAMTADVADEIRLEQGVERSGLLFAFTTLTTKLAGAMGIFASYQVLAAVDYKSGAENTPDAIQGMVLAYIVVPVVFMIIAALCLRGYPLSKAAHADIRRQLEERDDALMMQDPAVVTVEPRAT
jgi:Na+/melibiose symporter-like transporter